MSMLVTSQLSFQTTKFAIISFQPGLVPPHFEKGSATHGLYHVVMSWKLAEERAKKVN